MRATTVAAFLLAALLAFPSAASAQVGVGIRAGTLGLGADIAFALSPNIQIRGGGGIQPVNPTFTISDIKYTVDLPGSFVNIGIDLLPTGGGLRIGGGILYKPDDTSISGEFTSSVDIGGRFYTGAEVGDPHRYRLQQDVRSLRHDRLRQTRLPAGSGCSWTWERPSSANRP